MTSRIREKHDYGTSEEDAHWLNVGDTPGSVMAAIAWILILYCDSVVTYLCLKKQSQGLSVGLCYSIIIVYNVLVVLSLWSHLMTMLTDPGAVPRLARPLVSSRDAGIPETICGRCDAYKPARTHHCRICNRCVIQMDHHCPWMNNCIGALNRKQFMLFLIYTLAQSAIGIAVLILRMYDCDQTTNRCYYGVEGRLTLSLVIMAMLALIFVSSMLYNQVYAIMTGIGTIDRMKRNSRQIPHDPLSWLDVFGVDFAWIIPTPQKFKNRDTMLGYTTPSNSWTIKNTSSTDEAADDIAAGDTALLHEAPLVLL